MPKRTRKTSRLTDVFFRHMVGNMRNGVLAIARDGAVVLVNDEACRLFALPAAATTTTSCTTSPKETRYEIII
jgi:PAS domain-containing protein